LPAWAASAAKAALENRGFIAAVKRCATRNQNIKSSFSATSEALPFQNQPCLFKVFLKSL
jgi:hypothetical protein